MAQRGAAAGMIDSFVIRAASGDEDVAGVRQLVHAHGDALASTPGVELVHTDAERMPYFARERSRFRLPLFPS